MQSCIERGGLTMRGKLIKLDAQYRLHNEEGIVIATSADGKLSLKNCQAIERGYDLDELISEADTSHLSRWTSDSHELMFDEGFKAGFQKALELVGDRKSAEDSVFLTLTGGEDDGNNEFLKFIQPTVWDVKIETVKEEYVWTPPGEGFEDQIYRDWREAPKLDENKCLILKRIINA
jgi:hypothetical protein